MAVKINGTTIHVSGGSSVSVVDGEILVNGKKIPAQNDQGTLVSDLPAITIEVHGDAKFVAFRNNTIVDSPISVKVDGEVHCDVTVECGDIECGSVGGDVTNRQGNVTVSGNIGRKAECRQGNIVAYGNIGGDASVSQGSISASEIHGGASVKMGKIVKG